VFRPDREAAGPVVEQASNGEAIVPASVAVTIVDVDIACVGSTAAWSKPPSSALTVPNFGCGCVLSAVAATMPVELPFRGHVAP
jgi:hypothetical protein